MIALPNMDGNFTCIIFCLLKIEKSFANLKTKGRLLLRNKFPDAVLMPTALLDDFIHNPCFIFSYCKMFFSLDLPVNKIEVDGSLAITIVPFFRQGIITQFEDAVIE